MTDSDTRMVRGHLARVGSPGSAIMTTTNLLHALLRWFAAL